MISFVYVIGAADQPGSLVKIGVTTGIRQRLQTFQCGSPIRLAVIWAIPGDHTLEGWLHREFAEQRRHGEWFDLGPDPIKVITEALGPFMINVVTSQIGELPITANTEAEDDPEEIDTSENDQRSTGVVNVSALVRSFLSKNPHASDGELRDAVLSIFPGCQWDTIRKARDRHKENGS